MSRDRLSLDDVRTALGAEAASLSEVELIEIREHAHEMAAMLIHRADVDEQTVDGKAFNDAMSRQASRD